MGKAWERGLDRTVYIVIQVLCNCCLYYLSIVNDCLAVSLICLSSQGIDRSVPIYSLCLLESWVTSHREVRQDA